MTFPNPAERADWFSSNFERVDPDYDPTDADRRFGRGHRPAVQKIGSGWSPACGCVNPKCTRAEDDSRRIHPTWDDAWHTAVKNLSENENGPDA